MHQVVDTCDLYATVTRAEQIIYKDARVIALTICKSLKGKTTREGKNYATTFVCMLFRLEGPCNYPAC